jgi:hypothetical protein
MNLKLRRFILKLFFFALGPRYFLHFKYFVSHRRIANFRNPTRFTEMLQIMKLTSNKYPIEIEADKFLVRIYIERLIGSEFLIPLLFVANDINDLVDFIPTESCVIKPTHSSGNYLIIRNPANFNLFHYKNRFKIWLSREFLYEGYEVHYKYIKPRLLVEKLLLDNDMLPTDFKFHCFHGKIEFIYISYDREGVNLRQILDIDWNVLPFGIQKKSKKINEHFGLNGPLISKPINFDKMCEIALKLAQDRPYVRVDLFNVKGKIYFGELTHYHSSGFYAFKPDSYDNYYGKILRKNVI